MKSYVDWLPVAHTFTSVAGGGGTASVDAQIVDRYGDQLILKGLPSWRFVQYRVYSAGSSYQVQMFEDSAHSAKYTVLDTTVTTNLEGPASVGVGAGIQVQDQDVLSDPTGQTYPLLHLLVTNNDASAQDIDVTIWVEVKEMW